MATNFEKDLTGPQKDAFGALNAIFTQYGLGTLAGTIANFLKQGYSADTISLLLVDTPEYKKRFAANEVRRKKGMPVLTPAQYLATESSYREILRASGVPVGFYDQNSDFQKFMENDVSPQELQQRVSDATTFINSADANQLAYMKQHYTTGDLVAYALDPQRAEPLIGRAMNASMVGGQAANHGFSIDRTFAEQMANAGITNDQASQGFGVIQSTIGNDQKLAAISGTSISAQDEMNEAFFNDGDVTLKRQRLSDEEKARFGGSSAVGTGSLGSQTSGQI
jgi:hypothetical protein